MSVAPVTGAQPVSLSDLVDAIARRTGSWVVVERFGAVVTHGTGQIPCVPSLTSALLAKSTEPLRANVAWSRGSRRLQGSVDGAPVSVVDLGEGATAWFLGGDVEEESVPLLAALLADAGGPVCDPFVEALLHPRGPARSGHAPVSELVVLTSSQPLPALARAVAAVVGGTEARVHTEPDVVVVALPVGGDIGGLCTQVRTRCPDATAGAARVPDDAADWVEAAALARAATRAAARLGLPLAHATAPAVTAELVIERAQESVGELARRLGRTPLTRLQEHDERTSGELTATLSAWCAAGFDVAAAAAVLHVHANTLRYRLRRAGEVTGLDLSNPRQVLALRLLLT